MADTSTKLAYKTIKLATIVIDETVQQRAAGIDESTLADYRLAADAAEAWPFPPVTVFQDGDQYILADGFHRVRVAADIGHESIPVAVATGGRRDALLYAVGANTDHGLRRSNADKRRAVDTLLADKEWQARSDHWIAEQCAVSQPFVSKVRGELTNNGYQSKPAEPTQNGLSKPKPPSRKGRDGRTISTANIGRKPKPKPDPNAQEPAPAPPATTRRSPREPSPAVAANHAVRSAYTALCDVNTKRAVVEKNPEAAPGLVTIARQVLEWLGPVVDGMEGKP